MTADPRHVDIENDLVVELQEKGHTPMELVLQPVTAFELAAVVQLAMRHPGLTGQPRRAALRFLAGVRAYFADCPTVLAVIRRGDDPTEDRE